MKNIAFAQGLYATSDTQKEPLGTLRIEPDGRKFRYALAGGTLVAGKMCIMSVVEANHFDISPAVAASVGDTTLSLTLGATAAAADLYKDGYLITHDEAGEGYCYGIDTNAAAASSGTCEITLKNGLQVALTTASEVMLVKNPWCGITHSATEESGAAGVAMTAVTSGDYCWVQTGGLGAILGSATTAVGAPLSLDGTAGAVAAQANYTMNLVGIAVGHVYVSGEYNPIWLTID